jgi:hypothetical protein
MPSIPLQVRITSQLLRCFSAYKEETKPADSATGFEFLRIRAFGLCAIASLSLLPSEGARSPFPPEPDKHTCLPNRCQVFMLWEFVDLRPLSRQLKKLTTFSWPVSTFSADPCKACVRLTKRYCTFIAGGCQGIRDPSHLMQLVSPHGCEKPLRDSSWEYIQGSIVFICNDHYTTFGDNPVATWIRHTYASWWWTD